MTEATFFAYSNLSKRADESSFKFNKKIIFVV